MVILLGGGIIVEQSQPVLPVIQNIPLRVSDMLLQVQMKGTLFFPPTPHHQGDVLRHLTTEDSRLASRISVKSFNSTRSWRDTVGHPGPREQRRHPLEIALFLGVLTS